jgi:adenylate kinase
LLDGFPRTIAQAQALDAWLHKRHTQLDHVVQLHVDTDILIERITGRIVCASCGATYHRHFAPTRTAGVCDACGGVVMSRADDAKEKVVVRLQEYEEKTAPLIEYYRERHILRTIDGKRSKEEVAAQLDALFVCSAP